jgi:2-polyprenyl-6-methoxyphenol hydroxylase-like FAD-dependent oxidoreductase
MSTNDKEKIPRWENKTAVVIGSSIAGLLASHVLSKYFAKVTLIEREVLPKTPTARKGVPQGQHIHVLLSKGEAIIERFFPGILAELLEQGATCIDTANDMRWFHFGGWKVQFPSGITYHSQSRPLLEWTIRNRITRQSQIRCLEAHNVTQFLTNKDKTHITGVKITRHNQTEEEHLLADLVVDASGRGSRTAQWLEALGYPKVAESAFKIEIGYASRLYRLPNSSQYPWKTLFIYPQPPHDKRGGVIAPVEDDLWIVTLVGWLRDYPPTDEIGFLEFVQSLTVPDLYTVLQQAQAQTPIITHKLPSNLRRHYEQMSLPEGLIILGDALCSFNPVYGQGISTSAWSALTLDNCLRKQHRRSPSGDITGLSRSVQKPVAKIIDIPWLLATSEDLRYPEVTGAKPFWIRWLHWYIARVHRLSHQDPLVSLRFLQVIHMLKPPTVLFKPDIIFRVLTKYRS